MKTYNLWEHFDLYPQYFILYSTLPHVIYGGTMRTHVILGYTFILDTLLSFAMCIGAL